MNKKYLLMGVLAIAFAVAGGYGVKTSMSGNSTEFSALMLVSVEALAGDEFVQGLPGTNWKFFTKYCPRVIGGTTTIGGGVSYKGTGANFSISFTQPTYVHYVRTEVCGKGRGWCWASAGC